MIFLSILSTLSKVKRSNACLILDLRYIIMLSTDRWPPSYCSAIYKKQLSLHGAVFMI